MSDKSCDLRLLTVMGNFSNIQTYTQMCFLLILHVIKHTCMHACMHTYIIIIIIIIAIALHMYNTFGGRKR